MGIGIVLLFWAVIFCVLAIIGAAVLGMAARFLTRGVQSGRRTAIAAVTIFPFLCVGWAGAVFIFQAAINGFVFHHDPGIGDSWETPLPDGYAILMIDDTDNGIVYNPKTQLTEGGVGSQDDAIDSVSQLQLAGRYLVGAIQERDFGRTGLKKPISYFLMDTKLGKHWVYSDEKTFRDAIAPLGIRPSLEPIEKVYSRYRYTWFDAFAAFLLLAPPGAAFVLLLWWIGRLRKTRDMVQSAT